jgi:hypothetical protein
MVFLSSKKRFSNNPLIVDKHISRFYSDEEISVFHEISNEDLPLDVYTLSSNKNKFNILLTSGMSSLEMNVDNDVEDKKSLRFAELMLLVPKEIEFNSLYTGEGTNDWIITMLKQTARFPHYNNTWIGVGHSIQATEDLSTYSNETNYVGALILPSITFNSDFTKIALPDSVINIYSVFPLYKNELEYKIEYGLDSFLNLLRKGNPKECFDKNRKNLLRQ